MGKRGGGGRVEGALNHLSKVPRSFAIRHREETIRLVLLVTLKPTVNEAASLQRKKERESERKRKKRTRAVCLTLKQTNESASWSCGVVCLEIIADCFLKCKYVLYD